jgi:hypothetical protein
VINGIKVVSNFTAELTESYMNRWMPILVLIIIGTTAGMIQAQGGGFGGSSKSNGRVAATPNKPGEAVSALQFRYEKAPFVGVSISPVPIVLRVQLRLTKGMGLVVDHVAAGSPAETAGVKQYDILYKLDDQLLINAHQFAVLVRRTKPNEDMKLNLYRQGKQMELIVKPKERDVVPLDDNNPWGGLSTIVPETDFGDLGGFLPFFETPQDKNNTTSSAAPKTSKSISGSDRQYMWRISVGQPGNPPQLLLSVKDMKGKLIFDGKLDPVQPSKELPKSLIDWVTSPTGQQLLKQLQTN